MFTFCPHYNEGIYSRLSSLVGVALSGVFWLCDGVFIPATAAPTSGRCWASFAGRLNREILWQPQVGQVEFLGGLFAGKAAGEPGQQVALLRQLLQERW